MQSLNHSFTVKLQSRANYSSWRLQFTPLLTMFRVAGIVDGTEPAPPRFLPSRSFPFSVAAQRRRLHGALHRFRHSFLCSMQTRLVMELHSLQKGDLSVTALLSKAKGIADTLQLAGHRISPAEFNAIIFRKLSAEFNGIIGALQQRSEPPSYQDLLGQLVSYEVLLHAQQPVLQPTAMLVQSPPSPTPPQSSRACRSQRGGRRNQGSGRGGGRRGYTPPAPGEMCQLCGILNHTAATCRRRFDTTFVPRPPAVRSAAYAQAGSVAPPSAGLLPLPS
ncbi:OLC1v1028768C1 [Oldenlandia corymbosa var. corymbosa]|uniref:OLC1v1028768C1 n=1 Tax=Oldenlandia corymbosa var. corymbosa TaxID=529605 RepID=A0AAV1CCH0_OLDCO|nr:OLC1v1028768C1 [Oldenlandia corymbosa var. corymbosa]